MTNQPSQAIAVAVKANRRDVISLLQSDDVKSKVALALPRHMRPDRMIRVMLTTVNNNPKLLNCSRESLLAALLKCSQYGLEPDGRHAHLIPYGDQVQLIFDYKGLVDLVRRSGEVADIHCDVVRETDEFEFSYGDGGKLVHKPNLKTTERGPIFCAYSYVKLKDGYQSYEVMSVDEVEAIKERSSGYQAWKSGKVKSSTWETDWNEMAKKTVFRRHTKWLPLSSELREKIHDDDDGITPKQGFAGAKPVFDSATLLDVSLPSEQSAESPEPEIKPEPEASIPPSQQARSTKPKTTDAGIHDRFQAWLDASGVLFDTFQRWGEQSGNIPDASSKSSIAEVDGATLERLLRADATLLKQLKGIQ